MSGEANAELKRSFSELMWSIKNDLLSHLQEGVLELHNMFGSAEMAKLFAEVARQPDAFCCGPITFHFPGMPPHPETDSVIVFKRHHTKEMQ